MFAPDDDSRRVLSRALADRGNSYRLGMRPADIMQQSAMECSARPPTALADSLRKLVSRLLKT